MRGPAISLAVLSALLTIAASRQQAFADPRSGWRNFDADQLHDAMRCAGDHLSGDVHRAEYAATTTSNANSGTSCQLNYSTQQLACQTVCARNLPSP